MLLIPKVGAINTGEVITMGEGATAYEVLKINYLGIEMLKHEYINWLTLHRNHE